MEKEVYAERFLKLYHKIEKYARLHRWLWKFNLHKVLVSLWNCELSRLWVSIKSFKGISSHFKNLS